MINKISLSGLAGSGKTTIGKLVAKKLSNEFISMGNYSRNLAEEKYGMDINEFQIFCAKNPNIDELLDSEFANKCNGTENLVIDYRLAHLLITNCLHVFLHVSETEAVERLLKADRIAEFEQNTPEFVRKTMNLRNSQMKERFLKTYKTDFSNPKNYDLVVDTDLYPDFNQIVEIIVEKFNTLNLCTF